MAEEIILQVEDLKTHFVTRTGVVKAVDRSGTEMFQTIDVRPAVDFSRLEEVLVVVGRRPPR